MKPGRQQNKLISATVLATLLFTVFMQSAYACLLPGTGAAMAFELARTFDETPALQRECHARVNPNQCLSECTASDQANGASDLTPAIPPATTVVWVLPALEIVRPLLALNETAPARIATPPPPILFCSLLL